VVRRANPAARRLLGVREGDHLRPGDLTEVDGRQLHATRQDLPDGWCAWHVEDVTEQRAEQARSRFLATASRRLGLSLHPGRTAHAIVGLAAELAPVAVVVLPVRGGASEWYATDGTGRIELTDMPAALRAALAGSGGLVTADLPWADGATLISLPGNGIAAGVLVIAGGPVDESLVEEFARRSGLALAAAALYAGQAGAAAVLRRSLQQPGLPRVAGMDFGAAYRPAEEGLLIGGDFYDVHAAGGVAMFVLGDVCGKGVHAAVSTGRLRQSIQALRRLDRDPVNLLRLLNDTMLEAADPEADPGFATVVLGTATPEPDGGLRLELAGGGHLPPLVVRRDGVEEIEIGGMLVGAVPAARFASRTVRLAPGETCVLYTDGITEARGGAGGQETLGEARLAALLAGVAALPAAAIAERVERHTTDWLASGAHDDIAVLAVQAPRTG
jgi:serine phosphatase RsbU (regulator of sigma subunit)